MAPRPATPPHSAPAPSAGSTGGTATPAAGTSSSPESNPWPGFTRR
jgi:hypothetical protein